MKLLPAVALSACLGWVSAPPLPAGLPGGYGVLVLARTADGGVEEAAADLADLLERAYGEKPVIRREQLFEYRRAIHIGARPDHPVFDDDPLTDEILVERASRGILITGSDNTATCFAVYRFLENFTGWRYYQPGPLGLERVDNPPVPPALQGDTEILLHEKSGFHSRNLSGLNTSPGAPDWARWNLLREKFKFSHAVHRIVTPDLFDAHPQWFAKDEEGEPVRPPYPKPHGYNDHPDLSNPEVRDFIVESLKKSLVPRPLSLVPSPPSLVPCPPSPVPLSISLGDSFVFGGFPETWPWRPDRYFRRWPDWSNHVFDFSNEVARRLTEYWNDLHRGYGSTPELYLGALSYLTWESPPDFEVHPSVVPYMTYDRSQWYDAEARGDDLSNMAEWATRGPRVLGTWDYIFGHGFLMPRSLTGIVADSIPEIHRRGVRAYYSQVYGIWPYDTHTTWLTARLLWDPAADADQLLGEFFREFHGPAAESMREFFRIAEQSWMSARGPAFWLRYWKDPWQAALYSEEDLGKMSRCIQQSLDATRGLVEPRYHERVRQTADLFQATLQFVRYQRRVWELQTGSGPADGVTGLRESLDATVSRVAGANPLAAHAGDLSWIHRYDAAGGALYGLSRDSASASAELEKWCGLQGFAGVPDPGVSESVLFDSEFRHINNPSVWHQSLMDSEGAVMTGFPGGGGFLAASVRRGHIYQPFEAVPGDYYL